MKYYGIKVKCSNCKDEGGIELPVGQKVAEQICLVCGCKTLYVPCGVRGFPIINPKETTKTKEE